MARQTKPEDERRKRVNFSLAPETVEEIRAMAEARRTTASALLDQLVRAEVERDRRRASK